MATSRVYALERMRRVLYEYKITGVKTNIDYLRRIMDTRDFEQGNYTTHFIEDNSKKLQESTEKDNEIEDMAIIAAYIDYIVNNNDAPSSAQADNLPISRWRAFGKQKGVLRI